MVGSESIKLSEKVGCRKMLKVIQGTSHACIQISCTYALFYKDPCYQVGAVGGHGGMKKGDGGSRDK